MNEVGLATRYVGWHSIVFVLKRSVRPRGRDLVRSRTTQLFCSRCEHCACDVSGFVTAVPTVAPPTECSLHKERRSLTFADEKGNLCESIRPVLMTTCRGKCLSFETSQVRLATSSPKFVTQKEVRIRVLSCPSLCQSIRRDTTRQAVCQRSEWNCRGWAKKSDHKFMAVILWNLNRFSKCFH